MKPIEEISVIIPAAGLSTRMGHSKLVLPWGSTTIIGQIIKTFSLSNINEILIVINPQNNELKDHLEFLKNKFPIQVIYNPETNCGTMLTSIQIGLKSVRNKCKAAMIALGDQPQAQLKTIEKIIAEFCQFKPELIAPSFNMRRGHPWLLSSLVFNEILNMEPNSSARDLLKTYSSKIHYVNVDNDSILQDIDTPLDYERALINFKNNSE